MMALIAITIIVPTVQNKKLPYQASTLRNMVNGRIKLSTTITPIGINQAVLRCDTDIPQKRL